MPLRAEELRTRGSMFIAGLENQDPINSLAFHLLEIFGDALAGDVPVEPQPVGPGLGGVRRHEKIARQFVPLLSITHRQKATAESQEHCRDNCEFLHRFPRTQVCESGTPYAR